jgi:hypothetical protein
MLDVFGCWVLAAALLAGHRLSQRPALTSGPHPLRNLACLLGFGTIGLAVVVSYNVQVAGPDAQAQGTTNITVNCESD